MTYLDQFAASQDEDFKIRVRMAAVDCAKDVYTEDPGTAGHAARASLAVQIVQASSGWVDAFAIAIAEVGVARRRPQERLCGRVERAGGGMSMELDFVVARLKTAWSIA